jgi:O-antigen/teichoic acid export membrane protein
MRLPSRLRFGASGILMLARLAGAGLGVLLQVILARALGATELGIYYIAVSLIAAAAVMGAVGYPSLATRFVARYRTDDRRRFLSAFLRTGLFDTLAAATALALAIAVAAWTLCDDPVQRSAYLVASLSLPAMALARFLSAVAAAERRFLPAFLPELVVRPGALLAIVLVLLATRASLTATGVLLVYAILSWSFVLVQLGVYRERTRGVSDRQERHRLASYWRRLAGMLLAMPLLTAMLADVHILLLSALLPPDEVGVFGVALKIAALFGFAVQVIQQTSMPDLADAARDRRLPETLRAASRANAAAIAIAAGSLLVVIAGGRFGLQLFGAEFERAYLPLLIAVLGILPRALAGPSLQLLLVTGHYRASIVAGGGSLAALAAFSIMLVPAFGIDGAAVAFAGAGLVSAMLSSILLWRLEGVRSDAFAYWRTHLPRQAEA